MQAGQKDLRGEAREKSTRVGVLRRYVGATLLRAGKFSRAIERNFHKRLLEAVCRHMSLFQQPARMIGGGGTFVRTNAGSQCDVGLLGVGGLDLGWPSAEEGPSVAKPQ